MIIKTSLWVVYNDVITNLRWRTVPILNLVKME